MEIDAKFVVQTVIGLVIAALVYLLKDKLSQVEKAQTKLDEGLGKLKDSVKSDMDGFRKDLIQVDKSVLEYKNNVTGKFAELGDKYVSKTESAKDQVTVQNQIKSLENRLHKNENEHG